MRSSFCERIYKLEPPTPARYAPYFLECVATSLWIFRMFGLRSHVYLYVPHIHTFHRMFIFTQMYQTLNIYILKTENEQVHKVTRKKTKRSVNT